MFQVKMPAVRSKCRYQNAGGGILYYRHFHSHSCVSPFLGEYLNLSKDRRRLGRGRVAVTTANSQKNSAVILLFDIAEMWKCLKLLRFSIQTTEKLFMPYVTFDSSFRCV